ncbi:MAG: hypothetical protein JWM59_4850 [Verrucomicrobiales bacterium]|nr:hypothetical protein [Verrucomicrobiales bacterium]
MNKDEQLRRLLRLKRYEKPEEGYFEQFLEDFHTYQRKSLATQSATSLWLERVQTALSAVRRPVVAWSGIAAYAGIMILVHAWPAPDHAANNVIINLGGGSTASTSSQGGMLETPLPPSLPGGSKGNFIPAGNTVLTSDKSSPAPAEAPGRRRTAEQSLDTRDLTSPLPSLQSN